MKNIINIVGVALLVVILFVVGRAGQAAADNIWQNSVPGVHVAEQYIYPTKPTEYFSTIPCNAYKHQISATQTTNYCVVNTGSYQVSDKANIIVPGSSSVYYLVNPANTSNQLIPLNNSSSVVQVANNGWQVSVIYNAYNNLNIKTYKTAKNLEITSTDIQTVLDPYNNNENILSINAARNVSANGEWFVGLNNKGIYKINIATRQLQYIRKGEYTLNGSSANLKLAVSNSGRYVAVYVGRNPSLEVVDTHTCLNTQASNGLDAKCDSNRFESTINSGVPNIYQAAAYRNLQFVNEGVLSFYVNTDWVDSTNNITKKILLYTSDIDPSSKYDYLALGDSYASGEGAYSYKDGTDEKLNKCHLSAVSYPYLIAKDGIVGKTESVACSGAKINDIININGKDYYESNPQSSAYSSPDNKDYVLQSFTPGNIRQIEFAKEYKPQNVTVSIGGNDIGFGKIVAKCVTDVAECYNTKQDRQDLINTIDNNYNNLVKTYSDIKTEAAVGANIYALGYPQVAKADGNCAINVKLTNNEIIFSNQLVSYLNRVINMAANQAGVKYIDIEHAFDGYRLCEAPSHALAVHGLTAGNDGPLPGVLNDLLNGPLGKESYHPNSLGHRLYTKAILAATNNFSEPMPNPVLDNPSGESAEKSALLDSVATGYDVYGTTYYNDTIAPDYTTKDGQVNITVDKNAYNLKPNQNLSVMAYSEPTNLGNITTLGDGTILGTVSIPNTIAPGYHTIKITGQTIFDTTVTIQKIIFVASSIQDIDGDGILNEQEVCLVGDPSGTDQDKDGIDDACDGTILEAPIVVLPPVDPPDSQDPSVPPPNTGGEQTPPQIKDNRLKTLKTIIQNKVQKITKTIQLYKNNFKPLFTMITSFVVTVLFSFKL